MLSIISSSNVLMRLLEGILIGFLLSFCTTPLMQRLAIKIHCVAAPKQDRWHSRPTPLLGGLSIFVAYIIPFLLFFRGSAVFQVLCLGACLSTALGLLDDCRHIKSSSKLIGQILIACLTLGLGVKFSSLGVSPLVSVPLTIFWIVGIMNAVNLLDNMDGLAGGIVMISAATLCGSALLNGHPKIAFFMSFIIGATLAFLRYNFTPAKIFMGDCGSMLLGYLLAVATILQSDGGISNLVSTLAVPVLALSVPIFDTTFVTLMRKFNQRPISRGGRDHTSHRLVAFGLSEQKAVITLYAVSFFFGGLSLLYVKSNPLVMMVLISLSGIGLFSFGRFLGEIKVYTDEEKLRTEGEKKGWIFFNGVLHHKRRVGEVLIDFFLICLSYFSAFLLRFEGVISPRNLQLILDSLPLLIGIKMISFFGFGLYRGVWRYVSLNDLVSIFKATAVGQAASVIVLVYLVRFEGYSRTVFIIDGLLLLLLVSGSRVLLRLFREFFISLSEEGKRILIMGAGDAGEMALREIRNNRQLNYKLVGFIDDDRKKKGYLIHGIPVLGTRRDLITIAEREKVEEILIAIPSVSDKQLADVYEVCQRHQIPCHRLPYVINIGNGGDGSNGGKNDQRRKSEATQGHP